MGVLLADTNHDRRVNVGDTNQTKTESGQFATNSNFRTDVNLDGVINSGDAQVVRSASGTALPPTP